MEECTHCKKETDERSIIDPAGAVYCSEDCMEEYTEKQDLSFDPHPYEDSYLLLRQSYIELLDNWEDTLNKKTASLENAVDELMEEIDELIGDHFDFIHTEGDNGPYAWEIYQYTLKLRELQKRIFAWRPNRKKLYWVTTWDTSYGFDKNEEQICDKIYADLHSAGYGQFIINANEQHEHPYHHWGINYVFDNPDMAKEAHNILLPICENRGVEITIRESHQCEAHCGDVLEADADTYVNGWFYCYSCSESGDHGIFTQQELDTELQYYEENEEDRLLLIEERRDWCVPFKMKIKRTCRAFEIAVPPWAECSW